MKRLSPERIAELDRLDPLKSKRDEFFVPEGVLYLDGNSLGVLPKRVSAHVSDVVANQWGVSLIRAWNEHGWFDLPSMIGSKIARLIGADADAVTVGDSTSVNVFKLLAGALRLRPERKVILSDSGNFPTDLYMAQGVRDFLDKGHELKIVAPEDVAEAIDETVAVMMLTEVDFKTGRRHDMKSLTAKAHAHGVLTLWDLAHSAGAFQVELKESRADFAVGCGYKYLNGGPGAPSFIYVAPEHQNQITSPLSGWWGHDAPFAFDLDFRPAKGIERMRVGTAPVLSLAALDAALDVFADVNMTALREKSVALCELFIAEVEARCPELTLISPRDKAVRGSQVSFACDYGYPLMQALIARGVIGDFRAPDTVRFGFTPLYLSYGEVMRAAEILEDIVTSKSWDRPEFKRKAKVT